jgi:hypothetical protein
MHFVLDIRFFSSIIYILYEGGRLRPPLVRPRFRFPPEQPQLTGGRMAKKGGGKKKGGKKR